MIYNLLAYIKANIGESLDYAVDFFKKDSPDNCIQIKSTGGVPTHWYHRNDYTVQILNRNISSYEVRRVSFLIYNLLFIGDNVRIGLPLPEVTKYGYTYPAIIASQIAPIQQPSGIGLDNEHRKMYSFNIIVTTK